MDKIQVDKSMPTLTSAEDSSKKNITRRRILGSDCLTKYAQSSMRKRGVGGAKKVPPQMIQVWHFSF